MVHSGMVKSDSELFHRVEKLEGRFDLILVRLEQSERSDSRQETAIHDINQRLDSFEKNQKEVLNIAMAISQQVGQIFEILDFDGTKDSLKRNRRVWEKTGDGAQKRASFWQRGEDIFNTWFWRLILLSMLTGVGYIAGHNSNEIKTLKSAVEER